MKFNLIFLSLAFLFLGFRAEAESLGINQYLDQIRESHLGFRAAKTRAASFQLEAKVGNLTLSPYFFANARFIDDSSPSANATNTGDQTKIKNYDLGVSKLFSTGTHTKVGYLIQRNETIGASPSFMPMPTYYQGSVNLEFAQPLWRNFFGSETRALVKMAEAEKLEISFLERYRMKQLLQLAEMAYWRAYSAQRILKVRESSLERAQKLNDWSSGRVRLHLADRSDLLQAQAALKTREFELRAAREEMNSASLTLNSLRGIETPEVVETLLGIDATDLDKLEPPVRSSLRDDTYAAEQKKRQAESASQFALEKARPSLDLTGSLSLAARRQGFSDAYSNSFSRDNPTVAVGLGLNAPLDFWNLKSIHDGAQASQRAAEMEYQRKVFDQEREWADLSNQFQSKKEELQLAREVEKVQREKLAYEQDRLKKGRTTTFQVLIFEQDFATARLNLILSETQLLNLRAQMKTFGDSSL